MKEYKAKEVLRAIDARADAMSTAKHGRAYHKTLDVHIQDLDSVLPNNRPTIEREVHTLINFERQLRLIDKVKKVLYYKSPDLEEYRPLGYLCYLERQLRSIRRNLSNRCSSGRKPLNLMKFVSIGIVSQSYRALVSLSSPDTRCFSNRLWTFGLNINRLCIYCISFLCIRKVRSI
ncbi:uncharacterized protein BT62DRAFT_24524 [Guyanagaster necrorhizus]|uniref:Uncharacterized protein n=1 Tax=Guyanagaster necrorhizus TaxID=856835 RepID=A0A9P8AYQ1_9AGAR|nr:uncharacterized protein BT62DRAFT_24524 [Guyanagaster necrorhizus MCA 3950]KAG7452735.1 hypothetical protein BT62DRAFT_24524 [Guyanagaster necrorhizus MCA 3950]